MWIFVPVSLSVRIGRTKARLPCGNAASPLPSKFDSKPGDAGTASTSLTCASPPFASASMRTRTPTSSPRYVCCRQCVCWYVCMYAHVRMHGHAVASSSSPTEELLLQPDSRGTIRSFIRHTHRSSSTPRSRESWPRGLRTGWSACTTPVRQRGGVVLLGPTCSPPPYTRMLTSPPPVLQL